MSPDLEIEGEDDEKNIQKVRANKNGDRVTDGRGIVDF